MKTKAIKKLVSAVCLVMAMCMTFQNAALAVEVVVPESSAVAEVAEPESSAVVEADETEPAAGTQDTAPEEAEKTDAPDQEDPQEEETEPEEPAAEDPATEEPTEAGPIEEDVLPIESGVLPAMAMELNGWTLNQKTQAITFWYWENAVTIAPIQAIDEVIYLPEQTEFESYIFEAGYYYFDETGALVLDGASTGLPQAVQQDGMTGKFLAVDDVNKEKMLEVTAEQSEPDADGKITVTPAFTLFCGKRAQDSLWYSYGELYNGFYAHSNGYLYYVENGVGGQKYSGKWLSSDVDVFSDELTFTGDDLWYSNGKLYTGYYAHSNGYLYYVKKGVGGQKYTGKWASTSVNVFSAELTFKGDNLYYYNGKIFSGYWYHTNGKVYTLTNGVGGTLLTGTASTSKNFYNYNTNKLTKGDGKLYSKGLLFTGGYTNGYFYLKGVKQTGWKSVWKTFDSNGNASTKSSDNTYYFNSSGKYVTGWQNLTRNGTKYRFYFGSTGILCKNLYKVNSAYKKKSTRLVVSRSTHTATLYASYGGSYIIPCKSFVVSTSKLSSNYKPGTYKLTSRKSWFIYGQWHYKWASYISGSGAWIHSEQYYSNNTYNFNASSYNNLGTNQSKQCVRMQVVNCKLIYDMHGGGYIKQVVLNTSSNAGPFGKMTLADNVDRCGKISTSLKYDPTDPAV